MTTNVISATSTGYASEADLRVPQQVLNQEDFLRLLVAQLTSQDPLNPKQDTEFIAQMASFSSLEQSKAMQTDMAQLRTEQQLTQANALIGRQVELVSSANGIERGTVTAVHLEDGLPRIVVNGQPYSLNQLLLVTANQ